MINRFDSKVVSWKISLYSDADLANSMLDDMAATLSEGKHPVCHNDCEGHCYWPGWIERRERAGIVRSMLKKGYSPDNSAVKGFFGCLKNDFFCGRDWKGVAFEALSRLLGSYAEFYMRYVSRSRWDG